MNPYIVYSQIVGYPITINADRFELFDNLIVFYIGKKMIATFPAEKVIVTN